jgi:hypothetical protein
MMGMGTGAGTLAALDGGLGLTMGTGRNNNAPGGNGYLPGVAYTTNYAQGQCLVGRNSLMA